MTFFVRIFCIVCLCYGVWACSGKQASEECEHSGLELKIGEKGETKPFQMTLHWDKSRYQTVYCGEGVQGSKAFRCISGGLHMKAHPESLNIVMKMKGKRTLYKSLVPEYQRLVGSEGACAGWYNKGNHWFFLPALPSFRENADFRTGFDEKAGLDHFKKMAVASKSALGQVFVVKFYIDRLDTAEPRVYFQNTKKHTLHYPFVRDVLGKSLTISDYEAQTYRGEKRKAMAGNLLLYPDLKIQSQVLGKEARSPLVIEFFPSDTLSTELSLEAYRLLEERLGFVAFHGGGQRLFYMPASERLETELKKKKELFQGMGALWLAREELYKGVKIQLLRPGVAFGTLRMYSPEELKKAVVSFQDILLLTRLPNELPIVGGTIVEELQTPLAHVNVAARSRGTPNMSLLDASTHEKIKPFLTGNQLVRFEVTPSGFSLRKATLEEAQAFWKSRKHEKTKVPEPDVKRRGLLDFANIGFKDSKAVGAKAANLAELYNVLKNTKQVPNGFAVPFHYYDNFIQTSEVQKKLCEAAKGDCVEEGRSGAVCTRVLNFCASAKASETLQDYIQRMLSDKSFVSETVFREACLDNLRYLIHHTPVDVAFGKALDAKVSQLVGAGKVRLRSSTNAEDLAHFSGAGLYRSISASSADPRKLPSSRIRKVWGSIWSWRAFEERSFWNIEHKNVRMGVAVHRSFPDEEANGVIITKNLSNPGVSGFYVNVQKGEASVTNPEDGALPEIFSIILGEDGFEIIRQRYSSLSPGKPVMTSQEISALYKSVQKIQDHFVVLYGKSSDLALDLEFKLEHKTRQLIIKQVRPYIQR